MEIKKEYTYPATEDEKAYTQRDFVILPGCCKESRKAVQPYMCLSYPEDKLCTIDNATPGWHIGFVGSDMINAFSSYKNVLSIQVKFCPYCGKEMPEIRLKDNPISPTRTDDDGYCGTCGKRYGKYGGCNCWPMEALYEVIE